MNHQGDHSEGHPKEARLVVLLAARLELVETAEMTILWERENRHTVGGQMLELELPLSLLTQGLEG